MNYLEPKLQAMRDMTSCGVSTGYLTYEREILEFTATEDSERVDFRKFNGGYHPKKKKDESKD